MQKYDDTYLPYVKKKIYTFFLHTNMFILELSILGPCLHSFTFKSNQDASLHKSSKSMHGMTSYNNTPTSFEIAMHVIEDHNV
jgi:hypothetical protein